MMGGPNFETPAELRLMRLQGVDAVGKALARFIEIIAYIKLGIGGRDQCFQLFILIYFI